MEAGLVEFGLFGFHGAGTAAIATRAGVPQPHLYASFRAKGDLFLACAERAAERAVGAGARRSAATADGGAASGDGAASGGEISIARASSGAASGGPDSDAALMLLQALATARDPDLGPPIAELLRGVRDALGEAGLDALLGSAAGRLLGDATPA